MANLNRSLILEWKKYKLLLTINMTQEYFIKSKRDPKKT